MGHRHTSEKHGSARGVLDAKRGFAAPAARRGEIGVTPRMSAACPSAATRGIPRDNTWSEAAHQMRKPMQSPTAPASAPQATLPVRVALFVLRFYKAYLSMLMAGTCRYEPTCSMFTYEAVERFGVLCGSWLGLKRLLRCQPFSRRFGFDPVPEEWPSGNPHRDSPLRSRHAHADPPAGGPTNSTLSNPKEAHS
jgi:putative membrane protein insertion efficiency factor